MQNEASIVVALAGSDAWLRRAMATRLSGGGMTVKDVGGGTSILHGVDVLVVVPHLVPVSGSAMKDAGLGSAGVTFGAAASSKVDRVVLVSRVGADRAGDGTYLGALGELERRAVTMYPKVTVVRIAHPYGRADDPGPVVASLLTLRRRDPESAAAVATTPVQPVFADDVLDVVDAAVHGRLRSGVVEVGGPDTMPLDEFAGVALASGHGPSGGRLGRKVRGQLLSMFGEASVAGRKFALPADYLLRHLADVWAVEEV